MKEQKKKTPELRYIQLGRTLLAEKTDNVSTNNAQCLIMIRNSEFCYVGFISMQELSLELTADPCSW
jgi:hypothetical protein